MRRCILLLTFLGLGLVQSAQAESLLLCGRQTVHLVHLKSAPDGAAGVEFVWAWTAEKCPQIPKEMHQMFATTDDCKPVAEGTRILITSSSRGCAVVEYPSGKAHWYAEVPNAHSIELLPHDRVVVASSVSPQGNCLVLFDLSRSNHPLHRVPLNSGHGVVWDAARERLWALGGEELHSYRLKDWESPTPTLELEQRFPLPDPGGHDLQPIPDSADLVVTSSRQVFLFQRDTGEFRRHPELDHLEHVKSVNLHPQTKRMVFIEATNPEQWWSHKIELLGPRQSIEITDHDLYKARWFPDPPVQRRAD